MLQGSFLRFYSICLLLITSTELLAKGVQKLDMSDIHKTCSKSPAKCLPKIDQILKTTPLQSRVWYDLMHYKFEALFLLQKIPELNELTKPWRNKKDLPIPFEISVYIYYGKSLEKSKNISETKVKAERKKFINKAKKRLALMNNIYPDPTLLVQLANLQMRVGEYEDAYQLLQSLLFKQTKYADIAFYLDLYGNLGHLADFLGYKIKAIDYWEKSLTWALKLGNNQQTATVYFNLASSEFTLNKLKASKNNYALAIHYATLAQDKAKRIQAQLSLANLFLKIRDRAKAKKIMSTIDKKNIPAFLLPLFIKIKSQL